MKIFIKSIFVFLIIINTFSACEKNSNVITPDYTSKLVIHSFLCPSDSVVQVLVDGTYNVFGDFALNSKALKNATVTMFDGEQMISFTGRDSLGFCYANYRIQPSHEYKLQVTCPGFPDVTATCKVPENNNLAISTDTALKKGIDEETYKYYLLNVKFEDVPNQINYYNQFVSLVDEPTNDNPYPYPYQTYLSPIDENNSNHNFETKVFSDKNFDKSYIIGYTSGKTSIISVFILEIDADYYKYLNSLEKYKSTGIPFTEYYPVYSNISGGYGIFASFVKHQKTYRLKGNGY